MDNEWVAPQVGALNLDHHETLDDQSSFPLFPAWFELRTNFCQFLPFFGAVEMKINLGVEVEELEARLHQQITCCLVRDINP